MKRPKDTIKFVKFYTDLKFRGMPVEILKVVTDSWQKSGNFKDFLELVSNLEMNLQFARGLYRKISEFNTLVAAELRKEQYLMRQIKPSKPYKVKQPLRLQQIASSIFNVGSRTRSHYRRGYRRKDGKYVSGTHVKSSFRFSKYF